jgi:hypothetical protein
MIRKSHTEVQVSACHRSPVLKKNLVPSRALLIFAAVLALTAHRVRPPEFASFISHDYLIKQAGVQDKKQYLERSGTEFAAQTATLRTAPPIADFALPPAYIGNEAQQSKGAYHNRPPPLG